MYFAKLLLFLVTYVISESKSETVDFFSLCDIRRGTGRDYDDYIPSSTKTTVTMFSDLLWSTSSNSCTVIFKAANEIDSLYFSFTSFTLTDSNVNVEFGSGYGSFYSPVATYNKYSKPAIGAATLTSTYMNVTATREKTYSNSLDATFEVFTGVYYVNNRKEEPYDGSISEDGWSFITRVIVGCVFGIIASVVVVIIIIVWVVSKTRNEKRHGLMANIHQQVKTTTMVPPGGYPQQGEPGYSVMPPTNPSSQPVGYPVQSEVYPSTSPPNQMAPVVTENINKEPSN